MSLSNRTIKSMSAARGAVLVVTMRWTDRLIGLVSTLILARLLVPEDFGIVAMASVVVGLIDTVLDLGVGSALIQNRDAGREEFDTAWTLRIAQAVTGALIIGLTAPYAADYFRDPRVLDVIRVMALTILIGGFENIGIVAFQKNMEFGKDFQFFFSRRVAGFVVTVALAFMFHSYWAMVIGAMTGRLAGVLLSYWLHDYRPSFTLVRIRQIWSFSQWVLVRNLGGYGLMQLDKFLVGRRTDATTMGAYTLADEIASMPTTELLAPLGRVLFPVFVKVSDDAEKLRSVFCKAIGVQGLFALPAGVGLALVAKDTVLFLLGEKWLLAVPLIQTLTLISTFNALGHSSAYLLLALGKVRLQALLAGIQLILLAILALVFFPEAGAQGIANIRLGTTALGLLIFVAFVLHYVKAIRLVDYVANTWRSIVATGIMALVLSMVPRLEWLPPVGQLALLILGGTVTYVLSILCLWRVSGCKEGAETYLLEQLHIKERFFKLMRVSLMNNVAIKIGFIGLLGLVLLITKQVNAEVNEYACGSLQNAYGPYDYYSDKNRLPIVEANHFTPEVENLEGGMARRAGSNVGTDLDYTLRAFPNHPRALLSMVRYGEKTRKEKPPYASYSVECYLNRAVRFKPDDSIVRMIYAIYLSKHGRSSEALKELNEAIRLGENSANLYYNIGLVYFDLKDYDKALTNAQSAYQMGFPLPGLRNKLKRIGRWKEPEATEPVPGSRID
ncbi:MAG: oligosaccharide flippase family protein [Sphingomonadales bacterium]|nr:oligosaccharide flippase family protein [Sphingomonadales bacterium]